MNIKTLSFGCRLNALESEKIAKMLSGVMDCAIVVNTCSVTAEAERQSAQTVRKLSRENPNAIIFVTGCGATRNKTLFSKIARVIVIDNRDKLNLPVYIAALNSANFHVFNPQIDVFKNAETPLSKKFIQIQNGCNHDCTYCVTRLLRGRAVSFPYEEILQDAQNAVADGYGEIVLTGVDTASYVMVKDNKPFLLADVCEHLLADVPLIQRLRLSSVDPASPEIPKIISLMKKDARFMPHLHLSMQSGSNAILRDMHRRHDANKLLELVELANGNISFSADIICGFPGETDDLFNETLDMVKKMNLIHVHAFPYSPRPGTVAADMPNQIPRHISKQRVQIINTAADENKRHFMQAQIGKITSVLVEENNNARTHDDLPVKIIDGVIPNKTICKVKLTEIDKDCFVGALV